MMASRIVTAIGRLCLFVALAAAVLPRGAAAQDSPAPYVIGETHTITSNVLGEERRLIVGLPQGYEGGSQRYPVMYLLDGDGHFLHTTGIIQFLAAQGYMPPMIVVAIPNTDRTRDLTPTPGEEGAERMPTAGGADHFLSFMADELIPWVNDNYRTADYSVLVGHSFGGLFAAYALLTRPEAFNAYVSISPSLWWNDRSMVELASTTIEEQPWSGRYLYMTMGNEGGDMLPAAAGLASVFKASAPDGFAWEFVWMDDETHGSIPHKSTYDALEWVFADFRVPGDLTALGVNGLKQHFATISEKYYPLDVPENLINRLGYQYMGRGNTEAAIEAFKSNVAMYPTSANVYDSLGDGYDAAGEDQMAMESYEKAYRMAQDTNHPALATYQSNYERMTQKLAQQ
ncbi:MAG: alpha/beta hydrolase-fold protein [Gemmatimonadales bacterium]